MAQNADGTHDLAGLLDLVGEIAGVADYKLALGSLALRRDTAGLTCLVVDDLLNGLVQHVGASVDGSQTSEGLRELAKAIQGIDVGRRGVTSNALPVPNSKDQESYDSQAT
jgi:hypothetical protein